MLLLLLIDQPTIVASLLKFLEVIHALLHHLVVIELLAWSVPLVLLEETTFLSSIGLFYFWSRWLAISLLLLKIVCGRYILVLHASL